MIIRHAEKPDADGNTAVNESGQADPRSLIPRGWQRAGAWAELFQPSLGQQTKLPRPAAIFASAPAKQHDDNGSKSRRPLETVSPLAAKLGIAVDTRFSKGDEQALAAEIGGLDGVVLVCWQHEDIPAIAAALAPAPAGVPARWPDSCFNVIFRFDRADQDSPWAFQQVVPVMLAGDEPNPMP
jgi:hypothetical protein